MFVNDIFLFVKHIFKGTHNRVKGTLVITSTNSTAVLMRKEGSE